MDYEFEKKWGAFCNEIGKQFDLGTADLKSILYLVGVQELGVGFREFNKTDKMNLYHIATCTLLVPYGYYKFSHMDSDGWPHFEQEKPLPSLSESQQERLMKEAVLEYFIENGIILDEA